MTRAEAFRKIIKEVPGVCFVTEAGTVISGSVLLDIYDKLNEDITVSIQTKERGPRKPRAKNLDIGKMVALHKAGWSYQAIGDEVGCAPGTAYYKIKEALESES